MEIDKIPTGKYLDGLLADHLFGDGNALPFSSDLDAMQAVLRKLKRVEIVAEANHFLVLIPCGGGAAIGAVADALPLAVARAALKSAIYPAADVAAFMRKASGNR